MSYAYLLAGENLEMAEAELRGFLRSQNVSDQIERTERLAETQEEPDQLKRLALTHEVSEIIERGQLSDLETDYRPEDSYMVRTVEIEGEHDTKDLQKRFGSVLSSEDNSVDLETPDEVLKLYLFEDKYVLGRLVIDMDRSLFDKRKNQNRPFSSPISLDPVTARLMVNLAEVPAGGHVLDPFCGTGGILIEAGLCGIGVHGIDISEEMVKGTQKNLEEYGIIVHDIREGDIAESSKLFNRDFDAVITDFPYGQASKLEGEPVEKFLDVYQDLGANKVVFMYDQAEIGGLKHEFEIYVHKNLTRYIYVVD